MPEPRRPRLPSIRAKTAMLVLACVLPSALSLAALSYSYYVHNRKELVFEAGLEARALAASLEHLSQAAAPTASGATAEQAHLVLADHPLEGSWSAALFNPDGTLLARTGQAALPAAPVLRSMLQAAGNTPTTTVLSDGVQVVLRSGQMGLRVLIMVPESALSAGLAMAMSTVGLIVLALLALGSVLAWQIGGAIQRSVRALSGPAQALGRGEAMRMPQVDIREADEVARALIQVDAELARYRAGLEALVAHRTLELGRSNSLLEAIFSCAPVGMSFLDHNARFVKVNQYLADTNGRTVEEHIGRTLPEVIGPRGVELEREIRKVLASGRPITGLQVSEPAPAAPDQMRHWIANYYPVLSGDGSVLGVNAILVDVSAQSNLAERLRESETLFRAIYEKSSDAHLLNDPEKGFIGGNQAAATLFGCSSVEELAQLSPISTSPAMQPDGRASDEAARALMAEAGRLGALRFEWLHQRRDGEQFYADVQLTSIEQGGRSILLGTVRDITARIRAEQAQRSLTSQLEAASSAKSEFVANMSHEIRTPMNAIIGLARLLEEAQLDKRERAYVAKIKLATQSLLGILNDVLDFSKIEAGQLALERTSFDLDQVLANTAMLVAESAWTKGVEPVLAVNPRVPKRLIGDPMRLEQILLNLAGNAVKFTEQGEVVLSVDLLQNGHDFVRLGFAVRDTGIGIAAERQEGMFDAFAQGDSSTSRKYGGTGLGLAISRRLATLMGGTLVMASELGKGSLFRFECSFGLAPQAGNRSINTDERLRGLSVLVVDDNSTARHVLLDACRDAGWQAASAASGAQGLAALREGAAFDLVFLDAAMPDLDGISVLTLARRDGAHLPPVIMLSASHAAERLEDMRAELGIAAVLPKPLTHAGLLHAVRAVLCDEPDTDTPTPPPLAGRLDGIQVLLVEDNLINQEVAAYILLHSGAAVDSAADGRQAVDMLAESPSRYDLVLMDIQMPNMNGYEAAQAIRHMGLATLPIIAMTANAMEDDRERARAVGMNAHIAKPIDVENLIATVRMVLTGRDAYELRAPTRQAPAVAIEPPYLVAGIDMNSTLARFGGNFQAFAGLLQRFCRAHGSIVGEVRSLLRGADRHTALQAIHKMRGVAANLGASLVAQIAREIEQMLPTASPAEVEEHLVSLEAALQTVLVSARGLPAQFAPAVAALPTPSADLQARLAKLLSLLQNNNLKALADFESLRPHLERQDPATATALNEAIAALSFANAAALVQDLLNRKDSA